MVQGENDIINILYNIFPGGKIVGKYILDILNETNNKWDQIDFIIPEEITEEEILELEMALSIHQPLEFTRIEEFENLTPCITEIRFNFHNRPLMISIRCDLVSQNFFTANNLVMAKGGKLEKRKKEYNNDISFNINDINEKIIKPAFWEPNPNSIENRYSYLRMMEFVEGLQNRPGTWNIDQSISKYFQMGYEIDESTTCPICRDKIVEGKTIRMQCGHLIHTQCLKQQMVVPGPGSDKCPTCRGTIIFE